MSAEINKQEAAELMSLISGEPQVEHQRTLSGDFMYVAEKRLSKEKFNEILDEAIISYKIATQGK